MVASVYLPYDSHCASPTQELREPVVYTESRGLELLTGCDVNVLYMFC